jgi:hypothetical protein
MAGARFLAPKLKHAGCLPPRDTGATIIESTSTFFAVTIATDEIIFRV